MSTPTSTPDTPTDADCVQYDPSKALGSMIELSDLAVAENANCLTVSVKVMYPHEKDTAGNARAKEVCRGCPIIKECGATAIARKETYGVWGGITEDERAAIKRAIRGVDPLGSKAPQEANLLNYRELEAATA